MPRTAPIRRSARAVMASNPETPRSLSTRWDDRADPFGADPVRPPRDAETRPASRFFKALSDPTRQKILVLLQDGALNVGEIVSHFDLAQPTISRHLSILREANLVHSERRGQHILYHLNSEVVSRSMCEFFGRFHQCRRLLRRSGS